jgi:hypothetical protein
MNLLQDPAIACPACQREWQDHPGLAHTCALATALAHTLRDILTYVRAPEYTRDITEQEIYFDAVENARRLVVKAGLFKDSPPEPHP